MKQCAVWRLLEALKIELQIIHIIFTYIFRICGPTGNFLLLFPLQYCSRTHRAKADGRVPCPVSTCIPVSGLPDHYWYSASDESQFDIYAVTHRDISPHLTLDPGVEDEVQDLQHQGGQAHGAGVLRGLGQPWWRHQHRRRSPDTQMEPRQRRDCQGDTYIPVFFGSVQEVKEWQSLSVCPSGS